jgi:hypothetical protein
MRFISKFYILGKGQKPHGSYNAIMNSREEEINNNP